MLKTDDIAFFGRSLETFQEILLVQAGAVFERAGITVPVRSCSLLLAIREQGNASASDLSRQLNYSHQLVLQKIPKLKKLGLISIKNDPEDKRRRIYKLTDAGKNQVERLEELMPAFSAAYEKLFKEVGDLQQVLSDASTALQKKPLEQRVNVGTRVSKKPAE